MKQWLVTLALGAAMFGFADKAAAQVDSKTANLWVVHNTQKGCKVVISVGAMYGGSNPDRVTWSGGCGQNGLAQGQGELGFFFHDGPTLLYADYHGNFSGGLMQGAWKFATWEQSGSELSGSGIYNYLTFQDGCMTSFEQQPVKSMCRMVAGRNAAAGAANRPAPGVLAPGAGGANGIKNL
jgi:hypothetical protein